MPGGDGGEARDSAVVGVTREPLSSRAKSVPASKIRRMFGLAAQPGVINLAIGEPDFATPEHIVAAARDALTQGLTKYTPSLGTLELRRAVAAKVRRDNHLLVDESWVVATAGAMEGLAVSMMTVLDPGDEVLIPNPGYTNFLGQARLVGAVPIFYPLEAPDFQIDVATLSHLVTRNTRAIVICSPANPTGAVLLRDNLEAIAGFVRENGLVVLSDETYDALVYDGTQNVSIASLPGMANRTFSIFSLSKTYAMTGWRLGYVVAHPDFVERMEVLQEHLVSCCSSVSQHAGVAALLGPQECVESMRRAYDERRKFLVPALNAMGPFECAAPKGAFYIWLGIRGLGESADEVADRLVGEAGVATVPGTAFNSRGEGFLRMSYAANMTILREAITRLARFVETG
jgi:aspartate/methionine/tyrosine aminotransferase